MIVTTLPAQYAWLSDEGAPRMLVSLFGEAMRGETPLDEFLDGFFRADGVR